MIKEYGGDLLNSKCDIICHQVNMQGIMGGGLARQIAIKYPECEEQYKNFAGHHSNIYLGGNVHFYKEYGKRQVIANCFSQNEDFTTNYEWLAECVEKVKVFAEQRKLETIGIPFNYGCGIADGDWNIVKKIWVDAFKDSDLELQIWKL